MDLFLLVIDYELDLGLNDNLKLPIAMPHLAYIKCPSMDITFSTVSLLNKLVHFR